HTQLLQFGAKTDDRDDRDAVLSKNIWEKFAALESKRERSDHKGATTLLSLGAHHASKVPIAVAGQRPDSTVRSLLEQKGFHVIGAYLVSDRVIKGDSPSGYVRGDEGKEVSSGARQPPLLDLVPRNVGMVVVPMPKGSPFDEIIFPPADEPYVEGFE